MTIYLVRHAKAGSRSAWKGDDSMRPLSKAGLRQADALVDLLAPTEPERILSSPYARCLATVAPLAVKLGIPVEPHDALAEGAPFDASWRLALDAARRGAILCSHGDVIGDVLLHAEAEGVLLPGRRLEKGATWALDVDDGRPVAARYLPPPQVA